MKRLIMAFVFAIAATLALASCGNSQDNNAKSARSSDFNAADVSFAQNMIPHHRQAIEMANLASRRASAPEVKRLAAKINDAQRPEIETMSAWLKDWGKKVPGESMGDMPGMGSHQMPGMMSTADMRKLSSAPGKKFDRMFLMMMIQHHAGAIKMAKAERSDGKNPAAMSLAGRIVSSQASEITEMKRLLTS